MLNLRCLYCQTPFTVGRAEMLTALITMDEKHQNHHDAHCPRCRRANSISRQRMELFFPNWREAAKQQASVAAAEAKEPMAASASLKTEPLAKAAKAALKTASTKKGAAQAVKAAETKKPRASKPSSAKKTTPSKTSPSKPTKPSSKDKKK
ncbi:MAG TPA: hypothetical protein PLX14_05820 [Anaerolineales bacterium]|nr:hypothetical protein [Anaerolineales bacterium]